MIRVGHSSGDRSSPDVSSDCYRNSLFEWYQVKPPKFSFGNPKDDLVSNEVAREDGADLACRTTKTRTRDGT